MKAELKTGSKSNDYPYLATTPNRMFVILFTGSDEGVCIWISDEYDGDIELGSYRQDWKEYQCVRLPSYSYIQLHN